MLCKAYNVHMVCSNAIIVLHSCSGATVADHYEPVREFRATGSKCLHNVRVQQSWLSNEYNDSRAMWTSKAWNFQTMCAPLCAVQYLMFGWVYFGLRAKEGIFFRQKMDPQNQPRVGVSACEKIINKKSEAPYRNLKSFWNHHSASNWIPMEAFSWQWKLSEENWNYDRGSAIVQLPKSSIRSAASRYWPVKFRLMKPYLVADI